MTPTSPKCCMCKKPTPRPAHMSVGQKRYGGWAPGRYTSVRLVYCQDCWAELERANQKSRDEAAAEIARIRTEFGL